MSEPDRYLVWGLSLVPECSGTGLTDKPDAEMLMPAASASMPTRSFRCCLDEDLSVLMLIYLIFGGDGISCWPEQKIVCETSQEIYVSPLTGQPKSTILPGTGGSLRRAASASPSPWLWERRAGSTSPSAWPRGRRAGSTSPSPWLWERRLSADPSAPPVRVRESLCVRLPCLFLNIVLKVHKIENFFGFDFEICNFS
jgi:hypothetical protein